MDLEKTMQISAAGMKAEGTRLRVVSENLANADSLPTAPGEAPYRRKVVTFKNELDRKMGVDLVKVKQIRSDNSDFIRKFDPAHPAADKDGYVNAPNVNPLIEMMDMKEAERAYQANLAVIDNTKTMIANTLALLH